MHRVSALLPSWDRSRQSNPSSTTTPAPSPTTAGPKAPAALSSLFGWAEKIVPAAAARNTPAPLPNRTRYGRETYWPTTLDKECDKAARIIKSFCFDGFLSQAGEAPSQVQEASDNTSNQSEQSEQSKTDKEKPAEGPFVTKKIPPRIIQNAVGLAVFSCMRSGLWMSGSGGSGLITARKADGTWSPPSAIILHTAELAFVMGVDIYDCLLVINSVQTLEMFTQPKLILGDHVDLAVGPLVADGAPEPEIPWREINDTVLTYVKARGKHQAVTLDGSLVSERANENERFYCPGVTILDILAGNVPKHVPEMRPLFEVIKAAEGRSDYDKTLMDWLAQQPAPGDADIESPRASLASLVSPSRQTFGLPDANDPDPFGIIGLEMAGIEIREAGTKPRPTSVQLDLQSRPASPRYGRFSRQSLDTFASRSNRGSCMSSRTGATAVTDAFTSQTDAATIDTAYSRANSDDGKDVVDRLPTLAEPDEVDYTKVDTSVIEHLKQTPEQPERTEPETQTAEVQAATADIKKPITEQDTKPEAKEPAAEKVATPDESKDRKVPGETAGDKNDADKDDEEDDDDDEDDEDEDDEEEPIICEVATASARPARSSLQRPQIAQAIPVRGAIVTIPKRVPPPLPPRSPARISRGSRSEFGDVSSLRSPLRNSMTIDSSLNSPKPITPERESSSRTTSPQPIPEEPSSPTSPAQVPLPSSPRHTKNASSTSTAVAVAVAAPATTAAAPISEGDEEEEDRTCSSNSITSDDATSHADEPASAITSSDDEYVREPITPQTAEAVVAAAKDVAAAAASKRDSKAATTTQPGQTAPVKIVSPSLSPSPASMTHDNNNSSSSSSSSSS